MVKEGDLVMLSFERWKVPGALTALKFYQQLQEEIGGKTMIVLSTFESGKKSHMNALVFVNGYKKTLNCKLLKVVSEVE
tara:strand:+ start:232 stop:468 length:237 start_codon:yes stop_codon:yes gene_type:complete